jgi:hypothetical protein
MNEMIKTILYFLIFTIFISCKKDDTSTDEFISKFSYLPKKDLPNRSDFYLFFVCLENGKFTCLPNMHLHQIYEAEYVASYSTYHEFLEDLFTNKLCLREKATDLFPVCEINEKILELEKVFLIKKFNLKEEKNHNISIEHSKLNNEIVQNIAYNLFKKNHMILFDDYGVRMIAIPFIDLE